MVLLIGGKFTNVKCESLAGYSVIIAKGQAIRSFEEYVKNIPAGQGTIKFQSKIEEMRC